jgi:hydroxymethylpyrimidine/phosphomethylpyrimidine kinase
VVVDPVMVATSGAALLQPEAVAAVCEQLLPLAALATPNLDEAGLLVGKPLASTEDMEGAALALRAQGARAVLVKGGHLPGETVIDLLLTESGEKIWMKAPRIQSANTHGTGCTLSSAIASHLALGESLVEAVRAARLYVREALQSGAQVRTGNCGGPLNHSHAPVAMHLRPLKHA